VAGTFLDSETLREGGSAVYSHSFLPQHRRGRQWHTVINFIREQTLSSNNEIDLSCRDALQKRSCNPHYYPASASQKTLSGTL
jgi:hypothetical protein